MSIGRIAILAAAVLLACGGCVERTMTITSDPPGALVTLSREEVGRTPVTVPFTWYADYEVILRHQGYETLKTHWQVTPPIHDVFPLDLLSELAPWTYRVERTAHFEMDKLDPPTDQELLERAEELRRRNEMPVER
mgnify:CR=1 FL=1